MPDLTYHLSVFLSGFFAFGSVGEDEQPVDERPRLIGLKPHPVLAAYAEPGKRRAFLDKFRHDRFGRWRLHAVHLLGEDAKYLGSACWPFRRAGKLTSVRKRQRIFKRIRRDLRLVVVRRSRLGSTNGREHRRSRNNQFFHNTIPHG